MSVTFTSTGGAIATPAWSSDPQPPPNAELYIHVVDGNDTTGLRNRRDKPFKTFEAAFSAANEWDRIRIITQQYGGAGKLNGTAAILINKGILVELESDFNNKGPGFENCVVTVTMAARRPVYFKGITFFNSTLDDSCVKVTSVSDHNVQFDDCYFINYVNGGTGTNKTAIEFSGQWLTSGTTGTASRSVIALLNRCNYAGKIVCGAGTVGSPYDMKGTVVINDCTPRAHSNATYGTAIVVNSGAVIVQNNPRCGKITLNGGMVQVRGCNFPFLESQNAINAAATDVIGKSILIIDNVNLMNYWLDPMTTAVADMGTVTIGANVLYSTNNLLIPDANLTIDANAKEYHAYLAAGGKATHMVNYNSMPVYGSGAALT